MPADAKQDRLPASGPWTKYADAIPPGFRVVQPPANVFDQFDAPATVPATQTSPGKDPWAAFPDAPPTSQRPTVLEINGRRVEVDGSFLSMSPEQQNSTVDEIAKSLSTAAPAAAPTIPNGFKVVGKTGQPAPRFPGVPVPRFPGAPVDQPGPWTKYGAAAATPPEPAGNVFDQFDAPAAPEQPISTGLDVVESAASGLPRGLIETIMSPVTLARMAESGLGYVGEKGADLGATMGMTPLTDEQRKAIREPSSLTKPFYDSQDKVRDYMNDKLHKPQTTPGKFAGTVAEFATPGGLPSRAARTAPGLAKVGRYAEEALGNVIFPALSSEGAGQAAEGTQYEGMMRFLGALFGNAGAAAGRAHNAPEAVIRRATEGTTDAEWQAARRLQDNNFGIDLSSPESLAQARGGASKLRDILRVVEGSTTGGNITAPFFAARPAQVDSAVGGVLDQIAPQSANPSVLGPRAAEAGTKAVREVEQARTAAVDPVYAAANTDQVPADQVQALLAQIDSAAAADKTGVLSGPLKELRGRLIATPAKAGVPSVRTPVTGPDGQVTRYTQTPAVDPVPEVPITDIENLDRTRKYFRDRMNLPQIGQDAITKEQNAAITNILTQLDSSMEGASQNFAAGKQRYADISKNVVQPIAEGPVGRVAAAQDTATAGNAILPQNPLAGSAGEAADATARLAAQDPETAAALVRQNLADRYSAAQTETQGGSREGAGAKFHKSVAGNDQRREVLDAVLRALPGGQVAAQAVPQLLEVLQATMRRDAPGSSTAANQLIHGDLGARSPIGAVIDLTKSLGASFLTQAGDAAKRAQLRGNLAHLGDILTGPEAVQRTRAARDRRPTVSYPEAGLRTLFESGQTLQDPRGAR